MKPSAARIVIAEGDAAQGKVLERALLRSEGGLSVRLVSSGTELVRFLGQERVDCVVCQAELPDASLPELMTQISEVLGRVPVVALSGSSDQQIAVECFRSGVADFLLRTDALFGDRLWDSVQRSMGAGQGPDSTGRGFERRQSELLNMAERDQLSGLYNRRYLERRLRSGAYQKDRRRRMGCVFLDIDRFKRINDTYGHSVGDRILKGVSGLISEQIRGGDAAIRWGGEEFVVLKASADLTGVWNWAQDLCNAVSSLRFDSCGREIQVTISAGVTSFATREMSHEQIDLADQAMLLAKRKGRNRVCTGDMVSMDKRLAGVMKLGLESFDARLWRLLHLSREQLGPTQWEHVVEHARRVEGICLWLAESLRLESGRRESLRRAALCHDLGKSFLPEAMLSQAGELKARQWRLMRRHPALGAELAESLGLCPMGVYLVRTHHDGPMRGKVAPLESGILAVADALAAMKAGRPYAPNRTSCEAVEELRRCSGEQFHPRVVQAVDSALGLGELAA